MPRFAGLPVDTDIRPPRFEGIPVSAGSFAPPPDVPDVTGDGTSAFALAPYAAISALRGVTAPVLPALEAVGLDTGRILDEAIQYYAERSPDLGAIPDFAISPRGAVDPEQFPSSLVPTLERVEDLPVKEGLVGPTAEAVGFVGGPVRAASRAAGEVAKRLPVGPAIERIARGMGTGVLLGEGDPEKTLEAAGTFGAFEFLAFTPNNIKNIRTKITNTEAWRKATIKDRNLVIQDLEDLIANPANIREGVTEADIVRRYGGKYFEQAIKRRATGEQTHVFEDVITPEAPAEVAPEVRGIPLRERAPTDFPTTEIPADIRKPVPIRRVVPPEEVIARPQRLPFIGPEGGFVEGAGEVTPPIIGQELLPEPRLRLPVPTGEVPILQPQGGATGPPIPIGRTGDVIVHTMPDGTVMPGPAHEGAVEGSERVATEQDLQALAERGVEIPEVEKPTPELIDIAERMSLSLRGSRKRPSQGEMRTLRDEGFATEHPDHSFTLNDKGRDLILPQKKKLGEIARKKPKPVPIGRKAPTPETANTFRGYVRSVGGINPKDPSYKGEILAEVPTQVKNVTTGLNMDVLLARIKEGGEWAGIIETEQDVLQALAKDIKKPVAGEVVDLDLKAEETYYKDRTEAIENAKYDEPSIAAEEQRVRELIATEAEQYSLTPEEQTDLFAEPAREEFKLEPTEPTPEEQIVLDKEKGVIVSPERVGKKAVIPDEKIPAPTGGPQESLLPPEKGKTIGMFEKKAEAPAPKKPVPVGKKEIEPVKEVKVLKIGDAQRVMGIDAILADTKTIDGVEYQLYNANKLKDKRGVVRIFDAESGEVVSTTTYPTFDQAEAKYKDTVGIVSKEPAPEVKAKPGSVYLEKGGRKPFTEFREIKKGKDKGKIEITLSSGKKLKVKPSAIKVFPEPQPTKTADKPKFSKLLKDKLGEEKGSIQVAPDEIVKALKDSKIDLPDKDMGVLEQYHAIPDWVAEKYPNEIKPIRENLRKRDLHRNLIKHDYRGAIDPFLKLKGPSAVKVAEAFIKGDQLGMVLTEKALNSKFTEEEKDGYLAVRDSLDYVRDEDFPDLMQTVDMDPTDIEEARRTLNKLVAYYPHTRKGKFFARASTLVKGEKRTVDGAPYKTKANLEKQLNVDGTFDQYDIQKVEGGYIGVEKEANTEQTLWREHFNDILGTTTGALPGVPQVLAKGAYKKAQLEKKYPDSVIKTGINKDLSESMYFETSPAVTQELLEAATSKADITPEQKAKFLKVMSSAVADTFKMRGWLQHGMKRQGVPGYDVDPKHAKQILVDYFDGWAGFKSKMIAARELWDVWPKVDFTGKPRLRDWADTYVKDAYSNTDSLDLAMDKARGVLFYQFIGAVVKSAALNTTQNFIAAAPVLSTETGWAHAKIAKEMARAVEDVVRAYTDKSTKAVKEVAGGVPLTRREIKQSKRLTEEEFRGLTRARLNGTVGDKLTEELMGQAFGSYGSALRDVQKGLRFMFGATERIINREPTYLVAFRSAKEKGMNFEDAADFAERVVDKSHFNYGKTNLPQLARGNTKILRPAYTFRTYPHNLLSLMTDLGARKGAKGKGAFLKILGALLVFGGLSGIPFYKDIEKAYMKATGKNIRSEIADQAGDWADEIFYGAPGLVGWDLTGSISTEMPTELIDILGVPIEWGKRTGLFMEDLDVQDYQRAFEDFPLTPQFIRYPAQSYRLATRGLETRGGKDIVDDDFQQIKLTKGEAVSKALGFQPTRISEHYRKSEARYQSENWWNDIKDDIVTAYTIAEKQGNTERVAEIDEKIDNFNLAAPDYIAPITGETLKRRAVPVKSKRKEALKEDVK